MAEPVDLSVSRLLESQREALLTAWMNDVLPDWRKKYPKLVDEDVLRSQSRQLMEELRKLFAEHPADTWEPAPDSKLAALLREATAQRAKQGFAPTDTALYLMSLKRILLRHLLGGGDNAAVHPTALGKLLATVVNVIDRLTLLVYEAYVETRERVIAQQSLSLLELSTPVVLLWDRMVMVPLIGVIDTLRARQITERLLEAIARHEAAVAILDLTGVPVLDTSVAGHLMKTVAAAQMLGARVVMTGISPDGAQTLVKLGVDFSEVTTRATLRAGVAEGLFLLGRRIVVAGGAP